MKLRYKYRIYPTNQQKTALAQLFGCCRAVWNDALAHCQKEYQENKRKPKGGDLSKRLTEFKKKEETIWLGDQVQEQTK